MKRIQFGHSDTVISFGKQCIEIPGICVLFSKLTSFSAPATQYVCPFFSNFPFFPQLVAVFAVSQFSTSQCFGRALKEPWGF